MSKLGKLLRHPVQFWADALRKRLGTAGQPSIQYSPGFSALHITDPVAVYFDGGQSKLYQLSQWIAPLKALEQTGLNVTIVCRTLAAFNWTMANTAFKAVYCKTIDDLLGLYQQSSFQCILYVNNAYRNFQSLISGKVLHVHINHGESDKLSTFSNQTKAYDYVLVSGPAAIDKYDLNLIKKDLTRYIQIGRPQIEHISPICNPFKKSTSNDNKLTVLYAPTWEGTHQEMNYSSIVSMGLSLTKAILETPGYRLIYRPHPNTGQRLQEFCKVQQCIAQFVQQHPMGIVQTECDINALFAHADIAIFDNSAVAVDYLAANKPMVLTNWLGKTQTRVGLPAMAKAARLIAQPDIAQLPHILANDAKHDPFALPRQQAKAYYLGNFDAAQQASTKEFVKTVAAICNECDALKK